MLFYERFFTASLQLILKMGSYFVGVKIKKSTSQKWFS